MTAVTVLRITMHNTANHKTWACTLPRKAETNLGQHVFYRSNVLTTPPPTGLEMFFFPPYIPWVCASQTLVNNDTLPLRFD